MAFEIIIKESTREQVKTREYKETGRDNSDKPTYGYVTDEKTEDVKREVYTQRVDSLDLVAVINAVNKKKEN